MAGLPGLVVATAVAACTVTLPPAASPPSASSSAASPISLEASAEPSATAYVPPTRPPQPTVAPPVAGPAWGPLGEPIEYVADRLSATTSSHGIAITIRAASSTFASADGLWVTTRLQNVGTNVLHWITDGCAINVGLSARTDVDWTYGAKQPGDFGVFKDWTLERYDRNQEPHPLYLDSRPDWAVDEGEFGCAGPRTITVPTHEAAPRHQP